MGGNGARRIWDMVHWLCMGMYYSLCLFSLRFRGAASQKHYTSLLIIYEGPCNVLGYQNDINQHIFSVSRSRRMSAVQIEIYKSAFPLQLAALNAELK